ncbi:hypothetical protein [uncultured Microbulbifer sp.]|uniref:hypothetical protein n=1 Tax=uncultured Microbulbifer sp. TaxID=348147 RepID=UPI0025DE7CFD|nr:hypothetical protein [uncultured Microbulbifer sp.]
MRADKHSTCIHPNCECLDYCEAEDPYSKTPVAACNECGRQVCNDELCEEYQEYLALLKEGYRRVDAAVRSGWKGAEEV